MSRLDVETETALWAGLAAVVILICAMVLPNVPVQVTKADTAPPVTTADTNYHCQTWAVTRGRQERDRCVVEMYERNP